MSTVANPHISQPNLPHCHLSQFRGACLLVANNQLKDVTSQRLFDSKIDALITFINTHCVAVNVFWLLPHNTDMLNIQVFLFLHSHFPIDISSLIVKSGFFMYFSATLFIFSWVSFSFSFIPFTLFTITRLIYPFIRTMANSYQLHTIPGAMNSLLIK